MATTLLVAAAVVVGLPLVGRGNTNRRVKPDPLVAARAVDARQFPAPSGATTLRHLAFSLIVGPRIAFERRAKTTGGQTLRFTLTRGSSRRPVVGPTVVYIGRGRDAHASGSYPAPTESAPPPARAGFPARLRRSPVYAVRLPRLAPGRYTTIAATEAGAGLLADWTNIAVGPATGVWWGMI